MAEAKLKQQFLLAVLCSYKESNVTSYSKESAKRLKEELWKDPAKAV